jgi:hypothetical protein
MALTALRNPILMEPRGVQNCPNLLDVIDEYKIVKS